jgi:hypothetical protein
LRFVNCNDLSAFPRILYSFYSDADDEFRLQRKVDIMLYPEDYVDIVSRAGINYCIAHVRSISDHPSTAGTIGSNVIRIANTHFDSINEKIGFCDPSN